MISKKAVMQERDCIEILTMHGLKTMGLTSEGLLKPIVKMGEKDVK